MKIILRILGPCLDGCNLDEDEQVGSGTSIKSFDFLTKR
jgi:hypothetical protein